TITATLGVVIALLLLLDAVLLPGIVRRVGEAERRGPPPREIHNIREEVAGRGHPADEIHTPLTRVIDGASGWVGEFVAYWSLLAVFVYYYEV
ncbi:MAG: TRAP transporter permease DctQ, partial [Gammaproteobacteria bacterium]|nr:TRAP transporter permease DctQ [Gammaproteobacteria bacterium]NIR97352.1 TRAP transporter permease DctQ [Gammaproteobacteria bacterium]NIT63011.1 TRAP transporter permease DctQ [Gammaproteobacteria bacterium]NIV19972.1 TRAP transporter permease DctQ [Gammaproteobacteria bacterium]NIY31591.1 TRAP transporter permease DctQ [Gammaproteobacteria bacterium]